MKNISFDEFVKIPFFVYGTLRNGFGNYEHLLKGNTIKEIPATIKGKMYSVSKSGGFPCVVAGNDTIKGELMYIKEDRYWSVMRNLDILEGYDYKNEQRSMYLRRLKEVTLENGEKVLAWVYIWKGEVKKDLYVKSGDWKQYMMVKG